MQHWGKGGRVPSVRSHASPCDTRAPRSRPTAPLTHQAAGASEIQAKLNEAQGFESIWKLACEALETADAIVFVGFRFPETDAYARERLLGAIRKNKSERALTIRIVLGKPGPDSERMAALLEATCATRGRASGTNTLRWQTPLVLPLYGQDFFTAISERSSEAAPPSPWYRSPVCAVFRSRRFETYRTGVTSLLGDFAKLEPPGSLAIASTSLRAHHQDLPTAAFRLSRTKRRLDARLTLAGETGHTLWGVLLS
jgi:hypothetical protein